MLAIICNGERILTPAGIFGFLSIVTLPLFLVSHKLKYVYIFGILEIVFIILMFLSYYIF